MEKNFAITPSVSISRSKFLRTSQHKTSFNLGDIVPVYLDEVLPGDTRSIDIAALVRMSTPIAPIMDDIELEFFAFFVPNRIIWTNWKKFMGEASQAGYDTVAPVAPIRTIGGTMSPGSIGDYYGLPSTTGSTTSVSALPIRGYAAIYNRWFRDQNVESPLNYPLGDGSTGTYSLDYTSSPAIAYKKSDYFTRALPYAQKGTPVSLPLGTRAPIKSLDPSVAGNLISQLYPVNAVGTTRAGLSSGWYYTSVFKDNSININSPIKPSTFRVSSSDEPSSSESGLQFNNLWADLSTATAATINQLREAFQLQKLLEKDALYGTRYWEILYGHFGVRSPDATLQDPEYLGGHKVMINVDQVLQTTGSDVQTPSNNSLGTPGANSVTGTKGSLFTKSFVEHGFIHIMMVARQSKHTYGQGINRMWKRFDRYDYYWPEFANLGAQEIKAGELYAQGGTADDAVFGYQEAWAEYRYKPSIVSGILNPSKTGALDYWTLADDFGSLPTLSTSFLKETRANLSRALVTGASGPDFIGDFYFRDTAVRAMPLYSIPGLIDHH